MSKPKHVKEVQKCIAKGYKLGVCDIDGVSYTKSNGEVTKMPRKTKPTYRAKWDRNGQKYECIDGDWVACK